MSHRGVSPQSCRDAVIGCVREYVRQHGTKRGLHLAAEAMGISERVARHAHEGTPFAADTERAARADAARLRLLNDTIAALIELRDQVERARHEVTSHPGELSLANARQRVDHGGPVLLA
jgi:hypothetical protein